MSGLFAVADAPDASATDPSHALDGLLARRPGASWHRIDRISTTGAAGAIVSPTHAIGTVRADETGSALVLTIGPVSAQRGPENDWPVAPGASIRIDADALTATTDLIGSHPLHVRRIGTRTYVATSAIALALLEPTCDVDPESVAMLLVYGQLLGTRTLFSGVEAIPAGTRWVIPRRERDRARQETRVAWTAPEERAEPPRRRAQRLLDAVTEAIRDTPDSPGALLLSGGLDSRLIAALATREGRALRAVTFGERGSADMTIARRVAAHIGLAHEVAPSTPEALVRTLDHSAALTDGSVSALHFQGVDVLPHLQREVGAEWNGFAGDAVLGGTFAHVRYLGISSERLRARLHRALSGTVVDLSGALDPPLATDAERLARAALEHTITRTERELQRSLGMARSDDVAWRVLMAERVGRLAATGLALDRHYLPVIAPFAHHAVLACMQTMQRSDRRFSRLFRLALGDADPVLARMPWQRVGAPPAWPWPFLAAARSVRRIAERARLVRRAPLIDYATWLRGPLADLRRSRLRSLAGRPPFSPDLLHRAERAPETAADVRIDGILMAMGSVVAVLDGTQQIQGEIDVPDPRRPGG